MQRVNQVYTRGTTAYNNKSQEIGMQEKGRITLHLDQPTSEISPLIYGQFIEFLGNCIEGGIYDSSPWLESHYYNWSRFICREGENLLEPFDFYAMRWLQIHIHGVAGICR